MIVKIYPDNPSDKAIAQAAQILQNDGVIVYPTDGVYALGCSVKSPKGVERLKVLKGKKESSLTVVCSDLSEVSEYARIDNESFRIMKRNLPGGFTFILPASSKVSDKILGKRKTVGIRIPDNPIALAIIRQMGVPMASTSVKSSEDDIEFTTDPELIDEEWGGIADMVIDGGIGSSVPTTVVDMTGEDPEIIREGGGELAY